MRYCYEIYLKHGHLSSSDWNAFLHVVAKYLDNFSHWQIKLSRRQNLLHYFLLADQPIPNSFSLENFLLKPCANISKTSSHFAGIYNASHKDNIIDIFQDFQKQGKDVYGVLLDFYSIHSLYSGHGQIFYRFKGKTYSKRITSLTPEKLLSIDFDKSKTILYKKFPKYFKLDKVTNIISQNSDQALLEIDPFPYFEHPYYLNLSHFDFNKHSLIIGGSGSGKSRFIASFIDKVYQNNPQQYKIVAIDPHDALYKDCSNIPNSSVINFQTLAGSIDLFSARIENINVNVELTLSLFQNLIGDNYNGNLERVLRYSIYLLMIAQNFSFLTLRKLLLDLEYRNQILRQHQTKLPTSVSHFFLTDFNELKSQHYVVAIAPIIAFIDEMQMVPVFNDDNSGQYNFANKVEQNFLTIFSLNRLRLGDKVTMTIAGLLMQQLFLFAQQQSAGQHLIIIIDEVATVQNPIIARFLSELRKYHASVILAGQYFGQIKPELRSAIFANIPNYYLFRVSKSDADLIAENLPIKVEGNTSPDAAQKALIGLKFRECLVRISSNDELMPIFKAHTMEYNAMPLQSQLVTCEQTLSIKESDPAAVQPTTNIPEFSFSIDGDDIATFSQTFSTNRKPTNKE